MQGAVLGSQVAIATSSHVALRYSQSCKPLPISSWRSPPYSVRGARCWALAQIGRPPTFSVEEEAIWRNESASVRPASLISAPRHNFGGENSESAGLNLSGSDKKTAKVSGNSQLCGEPHHLLSPSRLPRSCSLHPPTPASGHNAFLKLFDSLLTVDRVSPPGCDRMARSGAVSRGRIPQSEGTGRRLVRTP